MPTSLGWSSRGQHGARKIDGPRHDPELIYAPHESGRVVSLGRKPWTYKRWQGAVLGRSLDKVVRIRLGVSRWTDEWKKKDREGMRDNPPGMELANQTSHMHRVRRNLDSEAELRE